MNTRDKRIKEIRRELLDEPHATVTQLAWDRDGEECYSETTAFERNSGVFGDGSKRVNKTFSSAKYRNRETANDLN